MTERNEYHTFKADEIPCQETSDPAVLSKNPLVSVKMITYNHEPYIAQAIEGVVKQETEYPFELIIGEDCSTDRTREIVFDYQRKYPHIIRVITSDRNVGMKKNGYRTTKACRGKYIAFCEGDDYWHHPYKLQKQVDYMETHSECELVCSDFDVYHAPSGRIIRNIVKSRNLRLPINVGVADFVEGKGLRSIVTCTVMVRRRLSQHLIDSDPYIHQSDEFLMVDRQLWAELATVEDTAYMPESLATYRQVEESASNSRDRRKQLRFQISGIELKLYLSGKYRLPQRIIEEKQAERREYLLQLAFLERSSNLAEEAMQGHRRVTLKQWLWYYGAKNRAIHLAYRVAANVRALVGRRELMYWDE